MYKAIIFDFFDVIHSNSYKSMKAVFGDTQPIDQDMVELIKSLHSKYKIGLLSNAGGQYLRPILEEHGLTDLFDEIAISAEVGIIKPDPKIFRYILDQLGVEASEAIFIDDNPGNTAGAEAAGIHSIVFTSEKALRQELATLNIL